MKKNPIAFSVVFPLLLHSELPGAVTMTFEYDPNTNDTTVFISGSWDVDAGGTGFSSFRQRRFEQERVLLTTGGGTRGKSLNGTGITTPAPWVTADLDRLDFTIPNGDSSVLKVPSAFGFDDRNVSGPIDFTSDTVFGLELLFQNTTLSDLGFDQTEIQNGGVLTGPGGSVIWTATSIPEPSSPLLIALGLVGMGMRRVRQTHVVQ